MSDKTYYQCSSNSSGLLSVEIDHKLLDEIFVSDWLHLEKIGGYTEWFLRVGDAQIWINIDENQKTALSIYNPDDDAYQTEQEP